MISEKAKMVVDLGNSDTRVLTMFGKTKSGKPQQVLNVLSNRFGELTDTSLLNNPDYTPVNSTVFKEKGGVLYCNGDICEKEKGNASLRPSSSDKKYENRLSTFSLKLAFLQSYNVIADMCMCDISELDLVWDVTVLLPPSDIDLGKDKMKDMVKSINLIEFVMPKFTKQIKVDTVKVIPEGFAAFIGYHFTKGKVFRPGSEDLVNQTTLIVDVGAGTTDLCIIKDGRLVDSSRYSEPTGGNKVFQKVDVALRKSFGRSVSEEQLRQAALLGTVKVGAKTFSIIDKLVDAKKDVSTFLSSSIRNYLESIDMSINEVENILICGGGAVDGFGEGLESLGHYLKESMQVWMPMANFLEMPTETNFNGDTEVVNPRELNILGAGVLSE